MNARLVQTQYGTVEGLEKDGVLIWKNVPFARVEGRFQPPKPPRAWAGVRDATEFGAVAVQTPAPGIFSADKSNFQREDCLNLNIWSPGVDGPLKPVLVWLHGGAFVFGSGQSLWYDGTSFASQGEVVVVTINYRLGALGFLFLEALAGPAYAGSGNAGFLDQAAALAWVHENIQAFGGDPTKITIAGQSAGSMSTGVLLTMPGARPHIHQAIMQSGAPFFKTVDEAAEITHRFLSLLDLTPEQWPRLLDVPTQQFLAAQAKLELENTLPWGPVIDGATVPTSLEAAIEAGATANLPLLIGTTRDEFHLWGAMNPLWRAMPDAQMVAVFEQVTHGPIDERLRGHYVADKSGVELFDGLMALATDRIFWYPSDRVADAQSQKAPVWAYRFDWPSHAYGGVLGACHAIEIPFVFNTIDVPGGGALTGESPDRAPLALSMHRAWSQFICSGTPDGHSWPPWPPYVLPERRTMIIDRESRVVEDPKRQERDLWDSLSRATYKRGRGSHETP